MICLYLISREHSFTFPCLLILDLLTIFSFFSLLYHRKARRTPWRRVARLPPYLPTWTFVRSCLTCTARLSLRASFSSMPRIWPRSRAIQRVEWETTSRKQNTRYYSALTVHSLLLASGCRHTLTTLHQHNRLTNELKRNEKKRRK